MMRVIKYVSSPVQLLYDQDSAPLGGSQSRVLFERIPGIKDPSLSSPLRGGLRWGLPGLYAYKLICPDPSRLPLKGGGIISRPMAN